MPRGPEEQRRNFLTYSIPDDRELLASIGAVALRHGQLDDALRMTIKTLTDVTPQEARDGTRRQGSAELRKRVKKFAQQRLGECPELVRLEAIVERRGRATQKRNDLLHGLWAGGVDGAIM